MKMWIVFTITIIIGISGHLFVYFFETSIAVKKIQYEEKNKLSVSENTIRRHTLLVSGVNNELTADEATKQIKLLFPVIAKAADDEKRRLAEITKAADEKRRLAENGSVSDLKRKNTTIHEKRKYEAEPPLVVQMISDFEMLMPLKSRIETNGLKNEFYKERFKQTNTFDKK